MQGRFRNRVLGSWRKTNRVHWSLAGVGSTTQWVCPLEEGKIASLLSPSPGQSQQLIALHHPWTTTLFNTIEQHWIACSQPINHPEIKEKHLPLCFLMKAIFWLTAVFANMYRLLQNTLLSSTYHNMCLQLPHSFFLFLGTKAISSSIAGLQRKPSYKYIFIFNNGQQNFWAQRLKSRSRNKCDSKHLNPKAILTLRNPGWQSPNNSLPG